MQSCKIIERKSCEFDASAAKVVTGSKLGLWGLTFAGLVLIGLRTFCQGKQTKRFESALSICNSCRLDIHHSSL